MESCAKRQALRGTSQQHTNPITALCTATTGPTGQCINRDLG